MRNGAGWVWRKIWVRVPAWCLAISSPRIFERDRGGASGLAFVLSNLFIHLSKILRRE
ncbi:MAG: hypothetical protein AB8H03_28510 [Saprospiraceae bacterium]